MKGQVICMSSISDNYCIAHFKNKKLANFINNLIVEESEDEEWIITSEDDEFVHLGKPDNGPDYGSYYSISKSKFDRENVRLDNVYVETHKYHYIDLAKAFGLRNTLFGQKGDKRLTKKEALGIIKALNHGGYGYMMSLEKGRITKNCERSLRLESGSAKTDEKGITTVYFSSFGCGTALAVLKAASSKFPKTRIVVESHDEEWDSAEGGYMSHTIYVVKNGQYKEADNKYESYYDDDETYGEED